MNNSNKYKKFFLIFEILIPIIWFSSFVVWKIIIRNYTLIQALNDGSIITFMFYITLNLIILFRWKNKYFD